MRCDVGIAGKDEWKQRIEGLRWRMHKTKIWGYDKAVDSFTKSGNVSNNRRRIRSNVTIDASLQTIGALCSSSSCTNSCCNQDVIDALNFDFASFVS
ncbi:hypothetical protein L1987_78849 [Smallanthus sonchifolius]|uniref:Uncharacterized protein n=1 Tax=Smallanthus sonchifolius TaxID=185202 RepID=A0ACB8ZE30_9ASTR|nr:hypothetical protein L1987_78849 [Smallanthus sonchifolius]